MSARTCPVHPASQVRYSTFPPLARAVAVGRRFTIAAHDGRMRQPAWARSGVTERITKCGWGVLPVPLPGCCSPPSNPRPITRAGVSSRAVPGDGPVGRPSGSARASDTECFYLTVRRDTCLAPGGRIRTGPGPSHRRIGAAHYRHRCFRTVFGHVERGDSAVGPRSCPAVSEWSSESSRNGRVAGAFAGIRLGGESSADELRQPVVVERLGDAPTCVPRRVPKAGPGRPDRGDIVAIERRCTHDRTAAVRSVCTSFRSLSYEMARRHRSSASASNGPSSGGRFLVREPPSGVRIPVRHRGLSANSGLLPRNRSRFGRRLGVVER